MQLQQKSTAISARTVAREMTALVAYALLTGVAVSVLVALPVAWLAVAAS